ncbi:MAG: Zn-dependent hydrolase, partial [Acidobacteriota bacterium]
MNARTNHRLVAPVAATALAFTLACQPAEESSSGSADQAEAPPSVSEQLLAKYTTFRLTTDLSHLSDAERQMIPLLIDAAKAMDEGFWRQAYGDKQALLGSVADEGLQRFVEINYGPWDRLANNEPFIDGAGAKPKGANFYPQDMTREEFEAAVGEKPELRSLYTVVERDDEGQLQAVPYSQAYADLYQAAADKLRAAAELAEDPGLRKYLTLRAEALLSDEYFDSDLAWMDMKNNTIDVVIGPIENYEDALFNYKTANEAYVLIKDQAWSEKLQKYAAMLPDLQTGLPVPDEYKKETPGTDSDLGAYDVVYYAGDCNAGSKTIAINLPNDEKVQLQKGSRRLQLKNAMRAKFDKILLPIADVLIAPEQRDKIKFDAFFENTMFHEVA